ncbi:MAG: hypothetical protein MHPSP_000210 [Paramarteilia canceri]
MEKYIQYLKENDDVINLETFYKFSISDSALKPDYNENNLIKKVRFGAFENSHGMANHLLEAVKKNENNLYAACEEFDIKHMQGNSIKNICKNILFLIFFLAKLEKICSRQKLKTMSIADLKVQAKLHNYEWPQIADRGDIIDDIMETCEQSRSAKDL